MPHLFYSQGSEWGGTSGIRAVDDSCVFLLSKDDYPLHHHIIIMTDHTLN